jgi:hypothetical protein
VFLIDLAVPSVTTSRIICFSAASESGLSWGPGAAGCAGAGSVISLGCCHWPRATAAAAPASATGDTSVLPWPKAAAACSAGSAPVATLPLNAGVPRSHGTPIPTVFAVAASPSGPSLAPSCANAVLHDCAKSWCSWALAPRAAVRSCALWIGEPPGAVYSAGHETTVPAVAEPFSSTPKAVMVLKVEPGATCAVRARLRSPPPGPLATASTDPSLIRIATMADRFGWALSASSAAFWVRWSSVVLTVPPGFGSVWNSTLSALGSLPGMTTATPGEPPSTLSNCCCRPPSPTWSPIWYLPGLCFMTSSVTSPTRPSSAFPNVGVSVSCR